MLDFQLKQTTFRYGLAEGDDPHSVPLGVLMTLDNFVWRKASRIQKRSGTDAYSRTIGAAGALTAAKRLFTRNNEKELCLVNGTTLYTYAPTAATWTAVAAVPDVGLTQVPLLDPLLGVQASDTAVSGNLVITALVSGDPTGAGVAGRVQIVVTDLDTGTLILPVTFATAASQALGVRVVVVGTTAVVVYSGADASIRAITLNLSTFAISAPTVLRADRTNTAEQNWDAALVAGTSLFVLAYHNNAGGINLYSYNAALAVQANSTQATAVTVSNISVCADSGESLYVAYRDSTNALVMAYVANPSTMAVTVVPFTVEDIVATGGLSSTFVGVCRYSSTSAVVTYQRISTAGVGIPSVASRVITSAGALTAATRRNTFGVLLTSLPFMVNGKCYAFGTNFGTGGSSYAVFTGAVGVLLNLFPGPDDGTSALDLTHPLVGISDTLLGAKSLVAGPLPGFTAVSSSRSVGSIPFLGTAPNTVSTWRCALRRLEVTAEASVPTDLWRTVQRGPETFISGGVLSVYDGGDVFDYGFPYPPLLSSLITATPSGAITFGNYIYASHLEYRGASGLVYRGPTTVAAPLSLVTPSSVQFVFSEVNVGNKPHANIQRFGTSLPLFRTVANGTIPQRLTIEPSFNLNPVVYSNPSQGITDGRADTDIDGLGTDLAIRPALYTSGGVLDDQVPPSSVTMFLHVDRMFVLAGDYRTWWYSKTFNDDAGVAPGFNVAFRILMDKDQVAGASMDDKAIFFSRLGVSYMLGQGPAKDGTASDFTQPIKIQSDVGCTNARSVVSTPDGIMFLSARGLYLLSRGLEIVWIGKQVQDKLALFPTITSATLVPKRNEVRFTCNNAAGTAGIVIVYNYIEKQWSTATYRDTVGLIASTPIADACIWNDSWTFVTPTGVVYKESDTHCLDGNVTYVPGTIETAWYSSAGPLAYHSFRNFFLTGESRSDHDLRISCGFDSDYNNYPQTRLFAARGAVTSVAPNEELKISVGKRRKCKSIRFRIEDTAPSTAGSVLGFGSGPSLEAMGVEVGIIPGDNTSARKKG